MGTVWHLLACLSAKEAPGGFSERPELKAPTDRWHVGRPSMESLVELSPEDASTLSSWDPLASQGAGA